MCLAQITIALLVFLAILLVYKYMEEEQQNKLEGFYPRRWWGPGSRWGWRRPWYHGWGNWRPYGYYPAYSGYWKQCPSGVWCPQTMSCMSPACQ
jgi:hypothetical protein